jgi:hypothetical protein
MNRSGTALLMVVMAMSVAGLLCISFLLVGGYMRASSADNIDEEKISALARSGFDYAVAEAVDYYEGTENPQNIPVKLIAPWPQNDDMSPYALTYKMEQKTPGMVITAILFNKKVMIRELRGLCAPVIAQDGLKKWRVSNCVIK